MNLFGQNDKKKYNALNLLDKLSQNESINVNILFFIESRVSFSRKSWISIGLFLLQHSYQI